MPITFAPKLGQVLYCDFKDASPPEMVKSRPAVVVSRNNGMVCTVVPLSGTEPNRIMDHHHPMSAESLPDRIAAKGLWWAKCDMIETVSLARLDRPQEGRHPDGRRRYSSKCVTAQDLQAIQKCMLYNLCLETLTWPEE
jgi:uncharacterized protein YifN (PemK superfamily)